MANGYSYTHCGNAIDKEFDKEDWKCSYRLLNLQIIALAIFIAVQ